MFRTFTAINPGPAPFSTQLMISQFNYFAQSHNRAKTHQSELIICTYSIPRKKKPRVKMITKGKLHVFPFMVKKCICEAHALQKKLMERWMVGDGNYMGGSRHACVSSSVNCIRTKCIALCTPLQHLRQLRGEEFSSPLETHTCECIWENKCLLL